MAIPFFIQSFHLNHVVRHDDGSLHEVDNILVDGGMLSNLPVDVFDRQDGKAPRWPTFGLKLSARVEDEQRALPPAIHGAVQQALAQLGTITGFYDAMHLDREEVKARTIFIDTLGIRITEFDISAEDQQRPSNPAGTPSARSSHLGLRHVRANLPKHA